MSRLTKKTQPYYDDTSIVQPLIKYNDKTNKMSIIKNKEEAISWLLDRMTSRELSHHYSISTLNGLLINTYKFVIQTNDIDELIKKKKKQPKYYYKQVNLEYYVISNKKSKEILMSSDDNIYKFDTKQKALQFLQNQLISSNYKKSSIFYGIDKSKKEFWEVKPVYDLNEKGNRILRFTNI